MIGRGLIGEVERDLEAVPLRRGDEAIEVCDGAERRLDARVAAGFRADRPRAADGRRVRASSVLFLPLRKLRPIGWIGGR